MNSYSLQYWCVCQTHERKSLYIHVCVFSERQDEVVYYDTFESADDIREDDTAEREELRRLQVSARQLEARRGRITAKRSYLRNKRVCAPFSHSHIFSFLKCILLHTVHTIQCVEWGVYFALCLIGLYIQAEVTPETESCLALLLYQKHISSTNS